jgi:hypothetical protein
MADPGIAAHLSVVVAVVGMAGVAPTPSPHGTAAFDHSFTPALDAMDAATGRAIGRALVVSPSGDGTRVYFALQVGDGVDVCAPRDDQLSRDLHQLHARLRGRRVVPIIIACWPAAWTPR